MHLIATFPHLPTPQTATLFLLSEICYSLSLAAIYDIVINFFILFLSWPYEMNLERNDFPDERSYFLIGHKVICCCSPEMLLFLQNISFENILCFKAIFFQSVPTKVTIVKYFAQT